MESELIANDALLDDSLGNELLRRCCGFPMRHHPAGDRAAL